MIHEFTSTGAKFFAHQQVMENLRNKQGQPIVTHMMLTDVCNHTCAFCSVQHRIGDSLPFEVITGYLDILVPLGLKAVILSGGGNPILYKRDGKNFNDVVDAIHARGLEIGLITNGMPLREFQATDKRRVTMSFEELYELPAEVAMPQLRTSWAAVTPSTLDKCTWIRVSMAGLDHPEHKVFVPDVGPNTTLGFSYVAHDIYDAPEDKAHGKVSTEADVLKLGPLSGRGVLRFEDRIPELTEEFVNYCSTYNPRYLRLLPNCLEPNLIPQRCAQLTAIASQVNFELDREVLFVQHKPPAAPKACYLGYIHPVLNCDGYVYPCDSCVLNEAAEHSFANPWRVCHWSEIRSIYERPVRSLIDTKLCPGCVFTRSNELLGSVVDGVSTPMPPERPEHINFV